jgi:hypothetical protein
VIRQAISCDICASEKRLTNHWFVAHDSNGELRVTGWNSRNRLRPGSKHLCGQTCLHKLLDEFISRTIEVKAQVAGPDEAAVHHAVVDTDASLTADAAYEELQSSARQIVPVEPLLPVLPKPLIAKPAVPQPLAARAPGGPVAVPVRLAVDEVPSADEIPRFASRNWRADAWDRERERELRAMERRPEVSSRQRSGS